MMTVRCAQYHLDSQPVVLIGDAAHAIGNLLQVFFLSSYFAM